MRSSCQARAKEEVAQTLRSCSPAILGSEMVKDDFWICLESLKHDNKKNSTAKNANDFDPNRPSDVIWAHKPGERSLAARSWQAMLHRFLRHTQWTLGIAWPHHNPQSSTIHFQNFSSRDVSERVLKTKSSHERNKVVGFRVFSVVLSNQ